MKQPIIERCFFIMVYVHNYFVKQVQIRTMEDNEKDNYRVSSLLYVKWQTKSNYEK